MASKVIKVNNHVTFLANIMVGICVVDNFNNLAQCNGSVKDLQLLSAFCWSSIDHVDHVWLGVTV